MRQVYTLPSHGFLALSDETSDLAEKKDGCAYDFMNDIQLKTRIVLFVCFLIKGYSRGNYCERCRNQSHPAFPDFLVFQKK